MNDQARPWLLLSLGLFIFMFPSQRSTPVDQDSDIFAKKRARMVATQLASRDITDRRVLEVMGKVPRHLFVSPAYENQAYEDHPLPIDEGQTISQPYIVALMTQWLDVRPGQKVLEIGTGSGYQAAVLAHLTDHVYSVEIRENLAKKAAQTLRTLGYENVHVRWGDGISGGQRRLRLTPSSSLALSIIFLRRCSSNSEKAAGSSFHWAARFIFKP